jgi:phosphocarrier protein
MGLFSRKRDDDSPEKLTKELTIINKLGLHARPSAKFVKICSRFRCDVWVEKDDERVNGKSIMGLMMLAAGQGSVLKVSCEGADADRAMVEIETLVNGKFDED